jgi:hypothetical protein
MYAYHAAPWSILNDERYSYTTEFHLLTRQKICKHTMNTQHTVCTKLYSKKHLEEKTKVEMCIKGADPAS